MGTLKKGGVIKESDAMPDPIPSSNWQHWVEEYHNHTGTADNIMLAVVNGTATSTEITSTHLRRLDGGLVNGNYATWYGNLVYTVGTALLVFNARISGIVNGDNTVSRSKIGFGEGVTMIAASHKAISQQQPNHTWACMTDNGSGTEVTTAITAITNNDLLTIVLTSAYCEFFVNGLSVAKHVTKLPVGNLYPVTNITVGATDGATSRKMDVDYFSFKKYARTD